MQGKIVKGISGFYYVHVGEPGIYECKAKGAFRNQKIKPLVGVYKKSSYISATSDPSLGILPFSESSERR